MPALKGRFVVSYLRTGALTGMVPWVALTRESCWPAGVVLHLHENVSIFLLQLPLPTSCRSLRCVVVGTKHQCSGVRIRQNAEECRSLEACWVLVSKVGAHGQLGALSMASWQAFPGRPWPR